MMRRRMWGALATVVAVCGLAGHVTAEQPRNVILMISDGQGFNAMKAADYYTGVLAPYENGSWVNFAMQTSSANNPAGYNPASMASSFNYSKSGATDSASAASAMYTGTKIYDNQINMTTDGTPLKTIFESAAQAGKSVGAVSTVEFTHATPAAVFGHNTNRNNYSEMALEAIYGSNPNSHNAGYDADNYNGNLKVVMGTGNPSYNANGQAQSANYTYVGGSQAWTDLGNGTNGWTRIETKQDFQDYANGTKTADKLFGVAQNISTLQQGRSNPAGDFDPLLANQPTLADMTNAALRVLDQNTSGFAMMIEGGAVDWAGHANQKDRIIEEQMDFNAAVAAVAAYLDANTNGNNWSNTLVICTADHETGHLWGNGSGSFFDVDGDSTYTAGVDYAHLVDNGAGVLPGMQFFSGSHTNALVPFFARGAGSELFASYVIGTDTNLAAMYGLDGATWSGQYIDNTAIYDVMAASNIPEPATLSLLGFGLAAIAIRRRRARG